MAFDLLDNNGDGIAIITDTNSIPRATPENFTTQFDYLVKEKPHLIPQLVYNNGKGSILGFLRATGIQEAQFESDYVQHGEVNRLHRSYSCAVTGATFTSTVAHGLEPRMVVLIGQEGQPIQQGIVATIPSATTFTVLNDLGPAFNYDAATPVTVQADFSSRFKKGDTSFTKSRTFEPDMKKFYPQIIKTYQDISDSNLAQNTWIMPASGGPQFWNEEVERIGVLHDNKIELTGVFHQRAGDTSASTAAGYAQGMDGVVPLTQKGGNVSNDLIETKEDLSTLAKRIKAQTTCREFTIWCGHDQMAKLNDLCAGVNAGFVNGSHYGAFMNSKDMAINLDFQSVFKDGVQFHFCSWLLMDDPSLMAAAGFAESSIAYIMVPTGNAYVTENGNTITKPYLQFMYRANGIVNRRRQMKWFGVLGQQVLEDKSGMEILTEATVRMASANSFFVGNKVA